MRPVLDVVVHDRGITTKTFETLLVLAVGGGIQKNVFLELGHVQEELVRLDGAVAEKAVPNEREAHQLGR